MWVCKEDGLEFEEKLVAFPELRRIRSQYLCARPPTVSG